MAHGSTSVSNLANSESVLYHERIAMFRNAPFRYIVSIVWIVFLGLVTLLTIGRLAERRLPHTARMIALDLNLYMRSHGLLKGPNTIGFREFSLEDVSSVIKQLGWSIPIFFAIVWCFSVFRFWLWKYHCMNTRLKITSRRSIERRGVFSKFTSEIIHDRVQNIQIRQRFWQRVFNVGYIGISCSSQSFIEIQIDGIPAPEKVKRIINQCIDEEKARTSKITVVIRRRPRTKTKSKPVEAAGNVDSNDTAGPI